MSRFLYAFLPGRECLTGTGLCRPICVGPICVCSSFQAGVDIGVKKNIVFRWQPPAGHDVSDKVTSHFVEGGQSLYLIYFDQYKITFKLRFTKIEKTPNR